MKKNIALPGLCLVLACSSMVLMGCAVAGFSMAGIEKRDRPGMPIQVFSLIPADTPTVTNPGAHKNDVLRDARQAEMVRTLPTDCTGEQDPASGTVRLYYPRETALDLIEAARFRQREHLTWGEFSILMELYLQATDIPDPVQEDTFAHK